MHHLRMLQDHLKCLHTNWGGSGKERKASQCVQSEWAVSSEGWEWYDGSTLNTCRYTAQRCCRNNRVVKGWSMQRGRSMELTTWERLAWGKGQGTEMNQWCRGRQMQTTQGSILDPDEWQIRQKDVEAGPHSASMLNVSRLKAAFKVTTVRFWSNITWEKWPKQTAEFHKGKHPDFETGSLFTFSNIYLETALRGKLP